VIISALSQMIGGSGEIILLLHFTQKRQQLQSVYFMIRDILSDSFTKVKLDLYFR
jgi:hypothetical protein